MVTDRRVSLREAVSRYMDSLDPRGRGDGHEIDRFVRWCGRERGVLELTPAEISEYGEKVAQERNEASTRLTAVRSFLSYLKKSGLVDIGLAAHLKVPKGKKLQPMPGSKVSTEPVELSPEGYQNLKARFQALQQERIKVVGDIQRAMADKDFRENAPLDAAKERQAQIEFNLRELEDTLQRAMVRGENHQGPTSRIKLGNTVVLAEAGSGRVMQYTLVDAAEADPSAGKLSASSPVGKALVDKFPGQEVQVSTPRGTIIFRIERVEG